MRMRMMTMMMLNVRMYRKPVPKEKEGKTRCRVPRKPVAHPGSVPFFRSVFFWLALSGCGWFDFLRQNCTLSKHILISLKALVLIVLSFQGSKFWQQNTQLFLWLVVTAKATVYLCPSSWQKWYMTSGGVYLLQTTELLLWILVTTKLLPAYLRCSYQCLHGLSFTAPNFIPEKSILLIISRSMLDCHAFFHGFQEQVV